MIGSADVGFIVAQGPDAGRQLAWKIVEQTDVGRSDGAEIADRGIVRPLGEIQAADDLRHQKVLIGIALAVGVGGPVDRHVIDKAGEIRPVIQIEPAHQILVRLALARMDRHHQAGYGLVQLSDPIDRPKVDLLVGDRALAGGHGLA
jgi:hypothetical protein